MINAEIITEDDCLELIIAPSVLNKLITKHDVRETEVEECFFNREHGFLTDTREEHKTDPPTKWFIAKTDLGRTLKVCFMVIEERIIIKTAFEPKDKKPEEIYFRAFGELKR